MARSALFLRNPAPSAGWYFAQNDVAQVRSLPHIEFEVFHFRVLRNMRIASSFV